jgi:hypothetical protein
MSRRSKARVNLYPFKSKFEKDFHEAYPQLEYEKDKILYDVTHTYNPDWKVKDGVYIETKGLWKPADRAKHKYIREQHPELKVYLVFQNANNKLSRVSRTTYGDYCDKHDMEWTTLEKGIPKEWLE